MKKLVKIATIILTLLFAVAVTASAEEVKTIDFKDVCKISYVEKEGELPSVKELSCPKVSAKNLDGDSTFDILCSGSFCFDKNKDYGELNEWVKLSFSNYNSGLEPNGILIRAIIVHDAKRVTEETGEIVMEMGKSITGNMDYDHEEIGKW